MQALSHFDMVNQSFLTLLNEESVNISLVGQFPAYDGKFKAEIRFLVNMAPGTKTFFSWGASEKDIAKHVKYHTAGNYWCITLNSDREHRPNISEKRQKDWFCIFVYCNVKDQYYSKVYLRRTNFTQGIYQVGLFLFTDLSTGDLFKSTLNKPNSFRDWYRYLYPHTVVSNYL